MLLVLYAIEASKRHPSGFASIVRALRTLRLEQKELYELVERKALGWEWDNVPLSDLQNMFQLARQNGELKDPDVP
jgi:hypothetical protein